MPRVVIDTEATLIVPTVSISLCRDPKDDVLLEIAVAGQADYLVSADRDLTDDSYLRATMKAEYSVNVVTAAEFVLALQEQGKSAFKGKERRNSMVVSTRLGRRSKSTEGIPAP